MTRLNVTTAGATLALAVIMAGCTAVGGSPSDDSPTGNNRPAETASAPDTTSTDATTAEPTDEPTTTEPEPSTSDTLKFGQTNKWQDGLSITIGKPAPYKPSESAAGTEGFTKFVVFDVTIVNQTGKAWDPSLFMSSLQSANEEASEVYDSARLKDRPSTKLLNGREVKFKIAYGVKDPADLVLEVTPDFEHEAALYQS